MLKLDLLLLFVFTAAVLIENGATDDSELQEDISFQLERQNGTALSRKRRYLVFPAGSSFQLVFCLTYPSLGVGSYFVFGHTAALAWELPSTPLYYSIKDYQKKAEEEANAETTTTEIPHDIDLSSLDHDDHGDHSSDFMPSETSNANPHQKLDIGYPKWPTSNYNRQPVSTYNNPFLNFMKTSGYSTLKKASYGFGNNRRVESTGNPGRYGYYGKVSPGPVRGYSKSKSFQRYNNYRKSQLNSHVDPMYYSLHRRTRRDLYKKIENFLTALNVDGKACLLKAICEVTKSSKEKGHFLEEILKAIFRVKPHDSYPNEDLYDSAANVVHNCTQMYPDCKGSVWSNLYLAQK